MAVELGVDRLTFPPRLHRLQAVQQTAVVANCAGTYKALRVSSARMARESEVLMLDQNVTTVFKLRDTHPTSIWASICTGLSSQRLCTKFYWELEGHQGEGRQPRT